MNKTLNESINTIIVIFGTELSIIVKFLSHDFLRRCYMLVQVLKSVMKKLLSLFVNTWYIHISQAFFHTILSIVISLISQPCYLFL